MSGLVWVVQVEEYDNESVVLVAATLADAVTALKADYGPEYAVEWSDAKAMVYDDDLEPHETPDWYTIQARFKARPGLSAAHATTWSIRRHAVV